MTESIESIESIELDFADSSAPNPRTSPGKFKAYVRGFLSGLYSDGVLASMRVELVHAAGPGGGWPVVKFEGTKTQLRLLLASHLGSEALMLSPDEV